MEFVLWIFALIGVDCVVRSGHHYLKTRKKPEKKPEIKPAAVSLPEAAAAQDEDEIAAVISAACMMYGIRGNIRRITPLSYDEPPKPLMVCTFTIELISE